MFFSLAAYTSIVHLVPENPCVRYYYHIQLILLQYIWLTILLEVTQKTWTQEYMNWVVKEGGV